MNWLASLLSPFLCLGNPVDKALCEAHEAMYRNRFHVEEQACVRFTDLVSDKLKALGIETWTRDATITVWGGRRIAAVQHRFICWNEEREWCSDFLYPYRSTWESRSRSAGVL